MSSILTIRGGVPLHGDVKLSGAKNSILKLIPAAMFSNEDIILRNVPNIGNVVSDLEVIKVLGGKAEWVTPTTLLLNGSGIHSSEIPYELGSKYRTAGLLVAPLVFRFGNALIPKPGGCKIGHRPINRWIAVWEALGMKVDESEDYVRVILGEARGGHVNFKISTHMGTDTAILSALFVGGETMITNAAEESEVDDVIEFCNLIGGNVSRVEPRRIQVKGAHVFTGGSFTVQSDKTEAVTFAVAALLTGGNITIKGVDKTNLLAFINVLTKIGASYELSKDELHIWVSGNMLQPTQVTAVPAPGFLTDWQPLITLLLTQASGVSLVHDTIYTDRFGYTKDLNRMGAKIQLFQPSEFGIASVISDDMYDAKELGEPYTVAQITGPTKLTGTRMNIPDLRAGATLVLAALVAEGKSELGGYEHVARGYERFLEKLTALGAQVEMG